MSSSPRSVFLIVAALSACNDYSARCTVVADETALTAISPLESNTATITAGAGGSATVAWLVYPATDAGTAGLGAATSSAPIPATASIALVDALGGLASQTSLRAPSALTERKGSTPFNGVIWTGQGALFLWTEEIDGTLPDGTATMSQTLKLDVVFPDGGSATEPVPDGASCDMCTLQVLFASTGEGVSVLYIATPTGAGPTTAGYVQVSALGALLGKGPLPWLTPLLGGAGSVSPSLRASGQNLLLLTGANVVGVSAALAPLTDAMPLPNSYSLALSWSGGIADVATVWTETASPDGSIGIGVDPALYFQRSAVTGRPVTPVARVSTGDLVYGLAMDGTGQYGLVFAADGHEYFDAIDPTGDKRGGDLDFGASLANDAGANVLGGEQHLVNAVAAGRFVDIYVANGGLGRREVMCAP